MAPWGPRVTETSYNSAEGDKLYVEGVYSGPSGQLSAFMPLYKDVSDAAEYNYINTQTRLTAFSGGFPAGFSATNPPQTAGRVTLAVVAATGILPGVVANINAGAISAGVPPVFVGAYSPTNPSDRPSTGDIVRMTRFGVTPVQISSGLNPNVGDYVLTSNATPFFTTMNAGLAAAAGVSTGFYAGRVLATDGQISGGGLTVASGNQVTPGAAAGSAGFGWLVNAWIDK